MPTHVVRDGSDPPGHRRHSIWTSASRQPCSVRARSTSQTERGGARHHDVDPGRTTHLVARERLHHPQPGRRRLPVQHLDPVDLVADSCGGTALPGQTAQQRLVREPSGGPVGPDLSEAVDVALGEGPLAAPVQHDEGGAERGKVGSHAARHAARRGDRDAAAAGQPPAGPGQQDEAGDHPRGHDRARRGRDVPAYPRRPDRARRPRPRRAEPRPRAVQVDRDELRRGPQPHRQRGSTGRRRAGAAESCPQPGVGLVRTSAVRRPGVGRTQQAVAQLDQGLDVVGGGRSPVRLQPRPPQIGQQRSTHSVEQHRRGADPSVHQPEGMQRCQRLCQRHGDGGDLARREPPPPGDQGRERPPSGELADHHQAAVQRATDGAHRQQVRDGRGRGQVGLQQLQRLGRRSGVQPREGHPVAAGEVAAPPHLPGGAEAEQLLGRESLRSPGVVHDRKSASARGPVRVVHSQFLAPPRH